MGPQAHFAKPLEMWCKENSKRIPAAGPRGLAENDSHRAVVDELDGHVRAEDSTFHGDTFGCDRGTEVLAERLRFLWRRGFLWRLDLTTRGWT
jgi:hypothetical protein